MKSDVDFSGVQVQLVSQGALVGGNGRARVYCGGYMVSGWDKSPGPNNDYTPKPWSPANWSAFAGVWALVIAGFLIWRFYVTG